MRSTSLPPLALTSLALTSPTHPDENAWYPRNDPVFAWSAEIPTVVDPGPSAAHENAATEAYAVSGNYSYHADNGELQITDISNPESPVLVGSFALEVGQYAVTVSGNYVYVAVKGSCWDCGSPTWYFDTWYEIIGLLKIDVTNPLAPTLAGSFRTKMPGYPNYMDPHVGVEGNYAYFGDGDGRYYIGNIGSHQVSYVLDQSPDTVPDNIPEDKSTSVSYNDLADGEYYFHVAAVEGFEMGPVSHRRVGIDSTCGQKPAPGLRNSEIYWASYADYMDRELSADYLLSNNGPSAAANVYISGATASNGVSVCETGNCDPQITLAASYDTLGYARDVAVAGSYAYVADGGGLQIIDISNPAIPTLANSYDTPGYAYGVAVSGSYAYVADGDNGLQIISNLMWKRNPLFPLTIGNLTPGQSHPFTVKFKVPQGVSRFSTRFSGYGEDRCGNSYTY